MVPCWARSNASFCMLWSILQLSENLNADIPLRSHCTAKKMILKSPSTIKGKKWLHFVMQIPSIKASNSTVFLLSWPMNLL